MKKLIFSALVLLSAGVITACSSEQKDNANDTITQSSGYSDSTTLDTTGNTVDTTNAPPMDTTATGNN